MELSKTIKRSIPITANRNTTTQITAEEIAQKAK
jgi:hypothetical protein